MKLFVFSVQRDKENLAVITDHGVIEKLAKLADTDNDTLRAKLAQAMGNCCEWPGNRALFGGSGAVAPLVNYLGKISLVNCLLLLANCMELEYLGAHGNRIRTLWV